MNIELEDKNCPLGCKRNDIHILEGNDRLHNIPGTFSVVKCLECGLMRTNSRPTTGSIGVYYPDDYGPYQGTQINPHNSAHSGKVKKFLKKIFADKSEEMPISPPGSMLEIGSASGAFLHKMAHEGWTVTGIEYSEKAASAAIQAGYDVHIGSLEKIAIDESIKYDLIVGWMVLEHLHAPLDGLKKLYDWGTEDARLVFSVPNAGALEFKLFKSYWYDLHLPNHLYHYTPETIANLLQASGWEIEEIFHQRTLGSLIASMGYVLQDKGFAKLGKKLIDYPEKARPLTVRTLYPIAWLLSLFGQTGRMTIWAKKKKNL